MKREAPTTCCLPNSSLKKSARIPSSSPCVLDAAYCLRIATISSGFSKRAWAPLGSVSAMVQPGGGVVKHQKSAKKLFSVTPSLAAYASALYREGLLPAPHALCVSQNKFGHFWQNILLGRGDRLWAASSASGGALNSAIWYALVCTTQSRSDQLGLDSPIGPFLWTLGG